MIFWFIFSYEVPKIVEKLKAQEHLRIDLWSPVDQNDQPAVD